MQSIHYSHAHNDNTESTTHVGYDQYADDTDGKNCFKWRKLSCPAGYARYLAERNNGICVAYDCTLYKWCYELPSVSQRRADIHCFLVH